MQRRSFLAGILAAGAAPALAKAGVLMPVRELWKPQHVTIGHRHWLPGTALTFQNTSKGGLVIGVSDEAMPGELIRCERRIAPGCMVTYTKINNDTWAVHGTGIL